MIFFGKNSEHENIDVSSNVITSNFEHFVWELFQLPPVGLVVQVILPAPEILHTNVYVTAVYLDYEHNINTACTRTKTCVTNPLLSCSAALLIDLKSCWKTADKVWRTESDSYSHAAYNTKTQNMNILPYWNLLFALFISVFFAFVFCIWELCTCCTNCWACLNLPKARRITIYCLTHHRWSACILSPPAPDCNSDSTEILKYNNCLHN